MTYRPLAVVSFLLSATLLAQQQPGALPPLVEKVNVSVINVDATVLDAGKPVTGLTADDFELFEDGKPQRITNFYSVIGGAVHEDPGTSPAAAAAAPVKRFRRKAVLLVDNHFIDKHSRDEALRQLRTFIDSDYAGNYDWSIGTISAGVHVIQPFTSDKAVINAAIDRLLRGSAALQTAPLDQGAIPQSAQGVGATAEAQAAFAQDATDRIAMEANVRFSSTLDALRASARAVIDACRAYTSIEGKKLIVLVTGSMEIDNRGASSNGADRFATTPADNDREASTIREAMVREANAANFNIYIIKAAGVTSPVSGFDVGQSRPDDRVLGEVHSNDSLAVALSSETGGSYLTSNAVGQSIRTIDTTSGSFYSLGYSPKHFEDGKYHTISVRVRNHAYAVRSRSGYLDTSSDTRFEESLKVAVSATIPEGTLPVSVVAGQKSPKDRVFYVPITASLPMSAITTLRRGDHTVGRVHVFLSAFDENGENVAFNHAVQQIDLTDAQLKQVASNPEMKFRYTMKVNLNPGLYRVVVAVRDELTDEVGKATTVVDIRS